jgi:3-phosphoshikimate 1-carboxyvinyltransferase
MKAKVIKSEISGRIAAPASKSAVQRYIAGALLASGKSEINSVTMCNDTEAAIGIARSLGAKIRFSEGILFVEGGFNPVHNTIFCGESGLSARMFTPIAAIHDNEINITGQGSILKRPFDMAEKPLKSLGVRVSSHDGFLPLTVKGPLRGGEVHADGSISSQFITGLLMALPVTTPDSIIHAEKLTSKPYIDLTLKILEEFGIRIENLGYQSFMIRGGQEYRPGSFAAEGDWSGAAFLLVMGAIAGHVEVTGLDLNSPQADRAILDALTSCGAGIDIKGGSIHVSAGQLKGFGFNVSDCPDLAPPLTVLAAACMGKSVIMGTERLAAKESDRGAALEKTMNAIGASVKNYGNYIEIEGGKMLKGGTSVSFNDHRIAMALAISSLLCENAVVIENMECINKSYPGFISDFSKLGGKISLI